MLQLAAIISHSNYCCISRLDVTDTIQVLIVMQELHIHGVDR